MGIPRSSGHSLAVMPAAFGIDHAAIHSNAVCCTGLPERVLRLAVFRCGHDAA